MSDPTTPQSVVNLSDAVHQRSRLAIVAVLYELASADFTLLKRMTGLSEGNLGRHIQVLEGAGLVRVIKGYSGRKPQTILQLSPEGVGAFEEEVQVLRKLVAEVQQEKVSAARDKRAKKASATNPVSG